MARKKAPGDLLGSADPSAFPGYLKGIAAVLGKKYEFVKKHHNGKSGQTYQIRHRSDRTIYCLKTVKQSYKDKTKVRETLKKEVTILRPLTHRCLPKVYESNFKTEPPFFVCTFHPGETWEKFREIGNAISMIEATYVITSLIDTLEYLHKHNRTHCDLHDSNIMIGPGIVSDGILIIDLGSGHRHTATDSKTHDRGHLGFKPIQDVPEFRTLVGREERIENFEYADFSALGRLLALMKKPFFSKASSEQREALMSFAGDLLDGRITNWKDVRERFEYVLDPNLLVTRSERYLQREDGTRPQITLPATGQVRVGDAVLAIINTPTFQRLRGIKQLSFCEWHFPGATHTRFEHSIGVFGVMQQALRAVCRQREVKARFNQKNIDGALLASILHDVGHYPLAHIIEHYVAARYPDDIPLKTQIHHFDHSLHLIKNDKAILQAIDNHWGEDVGNEAVKNLTKKSYFLSDLLDGPIDCDKLDYLRRDGHHCGVSYGAGINVEEVVAAYVCSKVSGKLVIPEEKIAPIEGMIMAQDQMLSMVYWAKTSRALFAMFHRFLDIVIKRDTSRLIALVKKLKSSRNENEAMMELIASVKWANSAHRATAEGLISLHRNFDFGKLYLPIQKYAAIDKTNPKLMGDQNIYRKIIQHNIYTFSSNIAPSQPIKWDLVQRLRASYIEALKQKKVSNITVNDVLIDVPWGKSSSNMVKILRTDGNEVDITEVSHISESFFTLPAGHIAPIRVYLRPDIYARVASTQESLTKAAEEIFDGRAELDFDEDS